MSRIIEAKGERLAVYIPSSWEKGLHFFSEEKDFLQVGTWRYEEGVKLQSHIHREVKREITKTQEIVFIRSGKMAATIFDEEGRFVERIELKSGDALILLSGGHGYEILEDDTRILEVKTGPFLGVEVDKKSI